MVGQVILLLVTLLAAVIGATPAGAALSVGNLAGSFFNGAGAFVQCFMTVKASKPLWEKFDDNTMNVRENKDTIFEIPEIKLENISFQYDECPVLKNKNYTFCAGGKYAIMGESGSGKTTMSKIILGLLPNYTGNVWYGEKEQRDICIEDLYNHVAYVNDYKNCILVIEAKKEVTAVAEIVPSAMAFDIINYNHRSMQGEIELKKSILIAMGAELEPKRKELLALNKQLTEDVFFMLNNLNVRHNNRSKKDKGKYKEHEAKMSKTRLEKWYDELYQMMLLAVLLLDNVERAVKIKDLKEKIVGGQTNG